MKRFDIITIFPHSLDSYFQTSILKRAQEKKLIKITTHDLRQWTKDEHKTVDDKPYGGGAGMVMKVEPIVRALHELKAISHKALGLKALKLKAKTRTILLAANGKQFTQRDAVRLSKYDRLIFIAGRYEGIDARVEKFVDEKISIGPYVTTDGEITSAIIISAVARLIPGVIRFESLQEESFWNKTLRAETKSSGQEQGTNGEYPHYTRPEVFIAGGKKYRVPRVLLGGHHKEIQRWRSKKSEFRK